MFHYDKIPELPLFLRQVFFPFQGKQAGQGDGAWFSVHHQSASQFHLSLVLESETGWDITYSNHISNFYRRSSKYAKSSWIMGLVSLCINEIEPASISSQHRHMLACLPRSLQWTLQQLQQLAKPRSVSIIYQETEQTNTASAITAVIKH